MNYHLWEIIQSIKKIWDFELCMLLLGFLVNSNLFLSLENVVWNEKLIAHVIVSIKCFVPLNDWDSTMNQNNTC